MSGHGEDVDGFITEYQWESSRDGIISNTPNFSTDDLSPGYHTISFRVKDNDDQWSEADNVTIRIILILKLLMLIGYNLKYIDIMKRRLLVQFLMITAPYQI